MNTHTIHSANLHSSVLMGTSLLSFLPWRRSFPARLSRPSSEAVATLGPKHGCPSSLQLNTMPPLPTSIIPRHPITRLDRGCCDREGENFTKTLCDIQCQNVEVHLRFKHSFQHRVMPPIKQNNASSIPTYSKQPSRQQFSVKSCDKYSTLLVHHPTANRCN